MKNILVDMSAVILHHGHVRLIRKASKYGNVIIALTSDKEIIKKKKITPELNFRQRKEILLSIKGVKKVIKSKWIINESFIKKHNIYYLIHGHDNKNSVSKKNLITFKRTRSISTSIIRKKAYLNYKKKMSKT